MKSGPSSSLHLQPGPSKSQSALQSTPNWTGSSTVPGLVSAPKQRQSLVLYPKTCGHAAQERQPVKPVYAESTQPDK